MPTSPTRLKSAVTELWAEVSTDWGYPIQDEIYWNSCCTQDSTVTGVWFSQVKAKPAAQLLFDRIVEININTGSFIPGRREEEKKK